MTGGGTGAATRATALVLHPDCGRHDTGWGHPEHQGRLPAIVDALHRDTPAMLEHVLQAEAPPAALDALRRVHEDAMIERVRSAARAAASGGAVVRLDPDTVVSPASWDAARGAAGSALHAAQLVVAGHARTAFALCRPPGHHATRHQSMGFCLFNNVAIAARAMQAEHRVARVLIIDWDVHHGNGTQDIFYHDPTVFYLSLHLAGHYPGTGSTSERGVGAGIGFTRNVPLAPGTTPAEYRARFDDTVADICARFRPELIFVSAGFDCLAGDPLGGLSLEPADLHHLTGTVLAHATTTAGGRVICALEGGYAPARTAQGVRTVLRALAGLPHDM